MGPYILYGRAGSYGCMPVHRLYFQEKILNDNTLEMNELSIIMISSADIIIALWEY